MPAHWVQHPSCFEALSWRKVQIFRRVLYIRKAGYGDEAVVGAGPGQEGRD
jgi:hypothetical protein